VPKRPYIKVRRYTWLEADGTGTPGVGLFQGNTIKAHLTPAEATRLADRLHDLTDAVCNPEPVLETTSAEQE
jgi:hypothetical protein